MVEVMSAKKRCTCGSDDEPKQEFSSGNNSNSVPSVFSLSTPSFGSGFVPSNCSTVNVTSTAPSKSNITSRPQGESRAPRHTTPLQASLGFAPFSAQNNIWKASSSGGSGSVFSGSRAPPVPLFDFPSTLPSNTCPFGAERSMMETAKTGWFPPKDCYTNTATPAYRFPIFQPAHALQPTLPPFTSKAISERDAEKHLFSNGNEGFMPNSQKCKKCGGKAAESKQGTFDKHLPVSTTMDIPTQLKRGEYQCICSKLAGEDAMRGSRMAQSCLVPFIPEMMLPVIPIFNGAFGAVPENAGSGSVPATFMYPKTVPLFRIGCNLCGTPTASRENATPSFNMQPTASAGVIPLLEMFGRIHIWMDWTKS